MTERMDTRLRHVLTTLSTASLCALLSVHLGCTNTENPTVGEEHPRVEVTIFRLDGKAVSEHEEARQGSIVNFHDPYGKRPSSSPHEDSLETFLQSRYQNRRLDLQAYHTLELKETESHTGKTFLRIYDNEHLVKPKEASSVKLGIKALTGTRRLHIEAVDTGVTVLTVACIGPEGTVHSRDSVRVTGISEPPMSGRIVFVDALPDVSTSSPLEGLRDTTVSSLSAAVRQLLPEDNIVFLSGTHQISDAVISKSCVLAGVGVFLDERIPVTNVNLSEAPVLRGLGDGATLYFETDPPGGTVVLSGFRIHKVDVDSKSHGVQSFCVSEASRMILSVPDGGL